MKDNQMASLTLRPFTLKKTLRDLLMLQPMLALGKNALPGPSRAGDHAKPWRVPAVRLFPFLVLLLDLGRSGWF